MEIVTKDVVVASQEPNHGPIEMVPVAVVQKQLAALQGFIKTQMREGVDWGTIPGCPKPSLYKPGAEKLLNLHGLACRLDVDMAQTLLDWKGGFINYTYKASVFNPRTGQVIATCDGSCNSAETKYAKVSDPRTIANTLSKMAQKRAAVGATLMACRASDIFTAQDPDEVAEGGEGRPSSAPAKSGAKVISEGQRKRFYAIWKGAGKNEDEVRAYLKEQIGTDNSAEIPVDRYEALCDWAKAGDAQ